MRYIEKSDTPPKCLTDYISECDTLGVPRPFIAEEHCSTFFRYTINGEIIPNGEYGRWDDYLNNILPEGDVTDWRKRSMSTHSERFNPPTFEPENGLKTA